MIESIASLLLLVLPGYALLRLKWVRQKKDFSELDKVIFGFVLWVFYLVATLIIVKTTFPGYERYLLWFNYFTGLVIIAHWFFTDLRCRLFYISGFKLGSRLRQLKREPTLLFLVPCITFVVLITLYSPIIYQYDATAVYLIEGRQIADGAFSSVNNWPTFGDSMPVAPILYSWFYSLSANPILRLVPLCFFFLILATTSAICRKLFSESSQITRLALITLVSTLSLYWYMASSSLYLDLIFIFFITSSIYLLIHIIQEDSHKVTYLLFGINLALLAISKEFGVFYVWFILLIWLMQRYKKTRHDFLHSSVVTILMLTPFIIYNVGFQLIFSYYNAATVASTNIIRSFILIIFGLLLVLSLYGKDFQKQSFSRSSLLYTLLPFFIPLLFFGSTFFSLGSPFGSLLEPYLQRLSNLGIVFGSEASAAIPIIKPFDLFLSKTLIGPLLIPIILFFLTSYISRFGGTKNWSSNLLSSWFFYSLFIIYFLSFGDVGGGLFRRVLPLVVPVAIIAGKGIFNLLSHSPWLEKRQIMVFMFMSSLFLAYTWFFKLDGSEWWANNLRTLTIDFSVADVLLFCLLWLFLLFLIIVIKKRFLRLNSYKRFWGVIAAIILLFSTLTPLAILAQATRYPTSWDPAYYDEYESAKTYMNHLFFPVLDFYSSELKDDNSITVGFGVTALQYFLKRPFIDLINPRNWLNHLPLVQQISTDDLLIYLEQLGVHYFLIPTEVYFSRSTYESARANSTLLKLIETSSLVTRGDGEKFKFEKLADVGAFELHAFNHIESVDLVSGEYFLSQNGDSYFLYNESDIDERVVLWKINATIRGYRSINYKLSIPVSLSNTTKVFLVLKSNFMDRKFDVRLANEKPWANYLGWQFNIDSDAWQFYELNMNQSDSNITMGKFYLTDLFSIKLGFSVKEGDLKDIEISFMLFLSKNSS